MPGGAMVDVVHAAVVVEHVLRVHGEDRVRPERPDLAHELLAQGEVVGERAVGLVEERDAVVARRSPRRPAAPSRAAPRARAGRCASRPRRRRRWCSTRASPCEPSAIQRAAVAAGPKSASSGWATITMNRAGRQSWGVRASPVLSHGRRASGRPAVASASRDRVATRDDGKGVVLDFRLRLRSSPPTGEASLAARADAPDTLSRPARRARRGPPRAPRGPARRGRRP